MANSGTVTAGSAALASQYNNLRLDVLDVSTGHTHAGTTNEGAKVAATGVSSGTAALGAVLTADGSGAAAFLALAAAGADVQEFTSSGSWVKPAGKSAVYVFAIGGGGGGASGARGDSSADRGGGGGGGGAVHIRSTLKASDLPGTVTVTIGAGGAGGTATTSGTAVYNGVVGSAGGDTTFGTVFSAVGGLGGYTAAIVGNVEAGRVRAGRLLEFGQATSDRTSAQSASSISVAPTTSYTLFGREIQVGVASITAVGDSSRVGLDSFHGTSAGGEGGHIRNPTARTGSAGGRGFALQTNTAAAGGTANASLGGTAGNGAAAGTAAPAFGNGGAGGGASLDGTPGNGGAGYLGGGGGGGGAVQISSTNRLTSTGGAGGGGYVLVVSV